MSAVADNGWPSVPISEFCSTGSGGTPSRAKHSLYFGGAIPWVKSGELRENLIESTEETLTDAGLNESAAKLLPRHTILVALYGATVGRLGVLGIEAATNQAICHIIPDKQRADRRFLYYALQAQVPYWLGKRVGGGQPNISQAVIKETKISLPPLAEQRRIADILDKADAIRRKRREAVEVFDELLNAWFMTTVGPDAPAYRSWHALLIEDLAAKRQGAMRTGPFGSDLKHSEFVDEGIAVLGIDNAVQNQFVWSERRYITADKYSGLMRYRVYPGDVIITIMGTVGRSAVVPDNIPLAINTKHLACISVERSIAEPEFLSQAIHRHPEVIRQLGLAGRGAIMTGLNLGIIKSLKIPVPPIAVQRDFCNGVSAIRQDHERASTAESQSEALFDSLVQRAFRGDL